MVKKLRITMNTLSFLGVISMDIILALTAANITIPSSAEQRDYVAFQTTSTFDGKKLTGVLLLPNEPDKATSIPLIVMVQGMYRGPRWGLDSIRPAVERKGWMAAGVTLRGMLTEP